MEKTRKQASKEVDNLFRPPEPPWPDDPEFRERCRKHEERRAAIWRGHSEAVLDALQKAFGAKEEPEK